LSKIFQTSVRENKYLSQNHYLITLRPSGKITKPRPGQFFMLSADSGLDPLLKRPFSFHRQRGRDFQLLYRTAGKATNILKRKKTGDIINVMGPLGNGFPVFKNNVIIIAGGIGIAPLVALAESIIQQSQIPPRPWSPHHGGQASAPPEAGKPPLTKGGWDFKPVFFIGAKTKKELLCVNELKSIGIKPIISTDDGTSGQKGFITDVLKEFLTRHLPTGQAGSPGVTRHCLYACGPKPMLKEISLTAKKYNIKGYMALEENMACGIGACLSCVVNTKHGFKRVCKEGPVFPIEEIVW
jgi:dihydroorotate dehydrogenase electron transfer subunit